MIPKTLRPFVAELMTATADERISWNTGADDAYFATQKNADLHIRYLFDPETAMSAYQFRIVRGNGDAFFSVTSDEDDYLIMKDLFSAVSVNASGGAKLVAGLFD